VDLHKLGWLALFGALGTLSRYGLDGLIQQFTSDKRLSLFPWGIIVVNLSGCFAFGLICSICQGRWRVSDDARTIMLTGFMGAFTTFSTYIFEWARMIQDKQWIAALSNFGLHNIGGLVAMALGLLLGRLL
jgi:fluoride exporter